MSAFENVELPMTILGKLKPAEIKKRTTELLTSMLFLFLHTTVVGLQDRMSHLVIVRLFLHFSTAIRVIWRRTTTSVFY
jgi:hypothetical protein